MNKNMYIISSFKELKNFKPYRIQLVTTNSYDEIEAILSSVEDNLEYDQVMQNNK